MNTFLFSSIAASGWLLASASLNAHDSRSKTVETGSPVHARVEHKGRHISDYGPTIHTDAQAYEWGQEGDVAFAAPDGSSYSYDGDWEGEFVDPDGRVFEGEWQGTVTRHGGVSGSGYSAGSHQPPHAGAPYPVRHHEAPAEDRGYDEYRASGNYSHQSHASHGGYYYYPQAPAVTVVVGSGGSHTTTTVTEEVYYETARAAPRKRMVRKWKPRYKPRCVC